jgi:hypothetical protein
MDVRAALDRQIRVISATRIADESVCHAPRLAAPRLAPPIAAQAHRGQAARAMATEPEPPLSNQCFLRVVNLRTMKARPAVDSPGGPANRQRLQSIADSAII